jgi:lipoate-protein ligase A
VVVLSPGAVTDAWPIDHAVGGAAGFHDRNLPDPVRPALWWFEVTGPTVVLGSTQRPEVVDPARAAAGGVEVVRRRSGGGAVWLAPGEATWVDVLLPAGDPRWVDDVGLAAGWLGRAWARVLAGAGHEGATVHRGPMVRGAWSDLVCFAGLAPGEVTVGAGKAVGISQRRTRAGARFQCAVLHRWDPRPLLDVLALDPRDRARGAHDLASAGATVGLPGRDLVVALAEELGTGA